MVGDEAPGAAVALGRAAAPECYNPRAHSRQRRIPMTPASPIRIGTRGSPLALAQTEIVHGLLRAAHRDLAFEIVALMETANVISVLHDEETAYRRARVGIAARLRAAATDPSTAPQVP